MQNSKIKYATPQRRKHKGDASQTMTLCSRPRLVLPENLEDVQPLGIAVVSQTQPPVSSGNGIDAHKGQGSPEYLGVRGAM